MVPASSLSKIDPSIEDKYIPLEPKVKILLAVLVLLLPVVLFYFLYFSPNQDKMKRLERKKNTLIAAVKRAEKAAENLQKYKRFYLDTK